MTTRRFVVKLGDMEDIDNMRVSKCKLLFSKAGPLACSKSHKTFPAFFSLTIQGIVLMVLI